MATTKDKQQTQQKQEPPLRKRVEATLTRLERKDPGLKKLLEKAHGYAVFPSVGKAALVIGGAYGRGAVFEKGKMIGYATLAQMTLGVQIGGDTFTEIVIFHDKGSLDRFKGGQWAFAANASAVLVKAAAAGTSNFASVTAHAYSSGGMLLELSLGGQKFKFRPLDSDKAGKDDAKGKNGKAQAKGGAQEDDGEGAEEGDESEEGSGNFLSRAVEGVRGATSKVGDLAKERPIAATVAGVALSAGVALLVMRAMKGAGTKSKGREDQEDEDDDDTKAQGRDDRDDEDDESAQDEGDDDQSEDDDDEESNNHIGMKRRHRFRA